MSNTSLENLYRNLRPPKKRRHSKDRSKSYKLLTRVSDGWGNRTCLELAIAGKCRDFMSQVGVQELLSMIWRGNIHLEQRYLPVYVCLALPILPFLPSQDRVFKMLLPGLLGILGILKKL